MSTTAPQSIDVSGPRKIAALVAEHADLEERMAQFRGQANHLATRQREINAALLKALDAQHPRRATYAVEITHQGVKYSVQRTEQPGSPSYKSMLMEHVSADELAERVAELPFKPKLEVKRTQPS